MKTVLCAALVIATFGTAVGASEPPSQLRSEPAEQQLLEVLDAVERGANDDAYTLAESLAESYPTFQLAQLIYGDLLSAQGMGGVVFDDQRKTAIDKLRNEAHARLSHQLSNHQDLIAENLLMLSSEYRNVLVFELEKSRLYLFENNDGTPRLIDDYYMSIGEAGIDKQVEGDNKTPLGVYRITSYLPDEKLPNFMGSVLIRLTTRTAGINYTAKQATVSGCTAYHATPTVAHHWTVRDAWSSVTAIFIKSPVYRLE